MNQKEQEIYDHSLSLLKSQNPAFLDPNYKYSHSERCVEVPWFASRITQETCDSLLDIGFSLASADYMALLMHLQNEGLSLEALDIIKPERVKSRYDDHLREQILSVPVYIQDISEAPTPKTYDAVSMISTIEHIGFDKASYDNVNSAFDRKLDPREVELCRDPEIEARVLNHIADSLNASGKVFISVPLGKGGAVLLKDSLGYYTAQWEYEQDSWQKITAHPKFDLVEEHFYMLDSTGKWQAITDINDAKEKSSELKEHAQGVALCVLQKR